MTPASGGTLGTKCGLASLLTPLLDHFPWEGNGQNTVWGRGGARRGDGVAKRTVKKPRLPPSAFSPLRRIFPSPLE